jgi:hypothetical protein
MKIKTICLYRCWNYPTNYFSYICNTFRPLQTDIKEFNRIQVEVSIYRILHYETNMSLLKKQKPHNSSKLDSRVSRQLGNKQAFCQNVVSTKKKIVSPYIYVKT